MNILAPLKATVLQDGHVDHITGPRCMVQMWEGPHFGKYQIAHTDEILTEGTDVLVDFTGRARPVI